MKPETIPSMLKARPQWIVWKHEKRGGEMTKLPYQATEELVMAKSNDWETWASFEQALKIHRSTNRFSGLGFVFSEEDDFCGIDLDGCRDPQTGVWSDWARKIIQDFDTYTEMSPSGSGAKMFIVGKCPLSSGKNRKIEGMPAMGGKEPGIEVYDKLRYFAVTGEILSGRPGEPQPRQEVLDRYCKEWFPEKPIPTFQTSANCEFEIINRAQKYIARMPSAVSGAGGHNATFKVACVLILGFGLAAADALSLLADWNQTCDPPWSEKELRHKIEDAERQGGPRNYLRNMPEQRWSTVAVPEYKSPPPAPKSSTLKESAQQYLTSLKNGQHKLISLGVGDADYAIGGGIEHGEMVVIAARPGHGKTCVGLQAAYSAADDGQPVLIISEEMSKIALGKRTLQFASDVPQESWAHRDSQVLGDLNRHFAGKAPIYVVESVGTADRAREAIDQHVEDHGIKLVVIDYGQLLTSKGNTRYEQVSQTSIAIRQMASRHNLAIIVLAQLNRAVENREKFMPKMGDLRDSGQIEQDADVVLFLLWPHRLDSGRDPHEFFVFVGKNRSRPINQPTVKCRFNPSRQMILMEKESEVDVQAALDGWDNK